jgi:hypothetical protein
MSDTTNPRPGELALAALVRQTAGVNAVMFDAARGGESLFYGEPGWRELVQILAETRAELDELAAKHGAGT